MSPAAEPLDDAGFASLLEQHKATLYKVASAYCRDPHARRDLVQEMCIQLWRAWPSFDATRGVLTSTWVTRVAMNVAISGWRAQRNQQQHEAGEGLLGIDIDEQFAAQAGHHEDMAVLRQLIAELDELNRALLLLFLEGHEPAEIAAVLGLSVSNVTTRMTRLKQRLTARCAELERRTP